MSFVICVALALKCDYNIIYNTSCQTMPQAKKDEYKWVLSTLCVLFELEVRFVFFIILFEDEHVLQLFIILNI